MTFVFAQLLVTTSEYVTVTCPQSSCAVAVPVTFVAVLAGQLRTRSPGIFIVGGVVSATITSNEHAVEQMPILVRRFKVKAAPQAPPEITFTVCPLVAPEIAPLPVMDHA